MSLDDSSPWVKQRIEEYVAARGLRMEKRQDLLEQNLLRADMRDLVLLLIGQMI